MQILTFSTKLIFANDNDKSKLFDVLSHSRDLFNFCSEKYFDFHQSKGKSSIVIIHDRCYRYAKQKFPNTKSQFIIKAEQACLAAYRTITSNRHKIDKPIVKKRLSLQLDSRICHFKNDKIKITTLGKRITVDFVRYDRLNSAFATGKWKDPTLFVKNGEIYISFVFEFITTKSKSHLALGVDLGIRRLAATSDGQLFIDKEYNAKLRKLRYLKRCLQRTKTISAKRHRKKLSHNERNFKKNFNHHLTNSILKTKADTIVLENLQVSKLKSKKHKYQNKNRISQINFAAIRTMLTYKAALVGKQVVCVNPAYTSQADSITCKYDGIRQGCRYYAKSGLVYDADVNAAVNIARLSKLPISYCKILDGQATVNSPLRSSRKTTASFQL